MKILIVTQYFWPENFRVNDLALGLQERGHRVTVLTGIPNYPEGRYFPGYKLNNRSVEDFHGIKVIRVPLIPRGESSSLRLALNYVSFFISGSLFGALRVKEKFDIIFVCQYSPVTAAIPGIVLKKLQCVPVILWVQDLWPESLSATGAVRSPWLLGQVAKVVKYIYKNSDSILIQSEAFYSHITATGIKEDRLNYFPNWAEAFYQPIAVDKDFHISKRLPAGFRLMFAGNIGAAQDFETILSAAEKLKHIRDIHWIILGSGRMSGWVEEEVDRRGLKENFHLLGRFPVEDMPTFFSQADAMLVTLKREPIFALTIPSKVQSYLACGRPIVAALDGEGARVIEQAGAGLACRAEDPAALADTVFKMYKMPVSERQDMGLKAKRYYDQNFERELLLDRLENWLEKFKYNRK